MTPTNGNRNPPSQERIERARAVRIEVEAQRRGIKLHRKGGDIAGPCPKCGGTDRFVITPHGGKNGLDIWFCRGCEAGGDVIAFVRHCGGCSFDDAIATIAGNSGSSIAEPSEKPQRNLRPEEKTARAREWWSRAHDIHGTIAEQYLRSRGIRELPPDPDGVLRFHPHCPFGDNGQTLPCMLALVRDIRTDAPLAVLRTAFGPAGEKIGRMAFGPTKGGAVKLWDDAEVTTGLVIGEGVETVLGASAIAHRGTLLRPAWATIDAGHLQHFPVLAGIEALTILADHDESGTGQEAAQQCARRWVAAGRDVEVFLPKNPGEDFNSIAGCSG
jgi:phage/plasmid primase-like uncharacterized protein